MRRLALYATIAVLVSSCASNYRFTFPRDDRTSSSSFIAATDFKLPNSPAPEIALYNLSADNGCTRPGVVGYVPTQIQPAVDASGPKVWRRTFACSVEYEIIAVPAIDRDKYDQLRNAIRAVTPKVTPTLVPCEVLLKSADLRPETLDGIRVRFSSYHDTAGDVFWVIRLQAPERLSRRIESLMSSRTGLLIPTETTLQGVNLPINLAIEIKASLPVREE